MVKKLKKMAVYKLFFKPSVEKDLRPIPGADIKKILQRIEALSTDPRPSSYEKLTGQTKCRLRRGNYRIIYTIDNVASNIRIIKIGHRKDVYR